MLTPWRLVRPLTGPRSIIGLTNSRLHVSMEEGRLMTLLESKVALVTGGGRGLGLGIARALGQAGARVAIAARSAAILAEAAADLSAEGIDALAVPPDVADPAAIEAMLEAVIDWAGRINSPSTMPTSATRQPSSTKRSKPGTTTFASWSLRVPGDPAGRSADGAWWRGGQHLVDRRPRRTARSPATTLRRPG
jgi:short chain dehydrogenase